MTVNMAEASGVVELEDKVLVASLDCSKTRRDLNIKFWEAVRIS
jgi:hypothetical protein